MGPHRDSDRCHDIIDWNPSVHWSSQKKNIPPERHMIQMETCHVQGGYGKKTMLQNIDLQIHAGEFVGIIGPNASGKSTLLRLLSHVLPPQKGDIFLEGVNLRNIPLQTFSQHVAFVMQENPAAFAITVEEMVLFGRIPHQSRMQLENQKDRNKVEWAMRITDVAHLRSCFFNELSGGERQRVILAKALAQEPRLLFLDEPTSHLDIGRQVHILNQLKNLNAEGLTILIVLHDLNLASEYCDRLILLHQGQIVMDALPEQVLQEQVLEKVYETRIVRSINAVTGRPIITPIADQSMITAQNSM